MEIRNSYLEIYSDKVDENKCLIIMSDIHYPSKKVKLKLELIYEEVARITKSNKKVYICIVGDLIDSVNVFKTDDAKYLIDYCKRLNSLGNVYMVSGNHDGAFFDDKHKKTLYDDVELIKDNIPFFNHLDNPLIEKNITINGMQMGIEWYEKEKEDKLQFNNKIRTLPIMDKNKFNIFLFHSPTPFLEKNKLSLKKYENIFNNDSYFNNIDLIATGHMHGGLLPNEISKILKGRGLILPRKPLFPQGCSDIRERDGRILIISRGVTKVTSHKALGILDPLYKVDINTVFIKPKTLVKK